MNTRHAPLARSLADRVLYAATAADAAAAGFDDQFIYDGKCAHARRPERVRPDHTQLALAHTHCTYTRALRMCAPARRNSQARGGAPHRVCAAATGRAAAGAVQGMGRAWRSHALLISGRRLVSESQTSRLQDFRMYINNAAWRCWPPSRRFAGCFDGTPFSLNAPHVLMCPCFARRHTVAHGGGPYSYLRRSSAMPLFKLARRQRRS
jgi:hypothetical protein